MSNGSNRCQCNPQVTASGKNPIDDVNNHLHFHKTITLDMNETDESTDWAVDSRHNFPKRIVEAVSEQLGEFKGTRAENNILESVRARLLQFNLKKVVIVPRNN